MVARPSRIQLSSPEPESATSKVPAGVIDFDELNAGDPNQVSDYVRDAFKYYKMREVRMTTRRVRIERMYVSLQAQFRCPDYLNRRPASEITTSMRAILVDWLVEVQESFELNHETLYTAVRLLDRYLCLVPGVRKEQLQLVGATACLIACKIDERMPPVLDDFVYVCDDAYHKDDIRRLEREMFAAVGYDLGFPLSYRFLRRYGRVRRRLNHFAATRIADQFTRAVPARAPDEAATPCDLATAATA